MLKIMYNDKYIKIDLFAKISEFLRPLVTCALKQFWHYSLILRNSQIINKFGNLNEINSNKKIE